MGFGLTFLLAVKAAVLFLTFLYLRTNSLHLLSLSFLYPSIISAFVSIASHPSINLLILHKKPDGTFPIYSTLIFSPYLYFVRIFSALRRRMIGEEPFTLICDGIYVGGWPSSPSAYPPCSPAIIDCTCELPRKMKEQPYLCIPTWDTRSPKPLQAMEEVLLLLVL